MPLSVPAEYKTLTPYIKRYEEIESDADNVEAKYVAYYCLLFAIEKGLQIKTPNQAFLYTLFDLAERSKATYGIESIESQKSALCENYAVTVFSRADDEDRAGSATMATAKSFYAAATFFDVLEQFGPLDSDLVEKRKYSKWRAAEILKALKEGRAPSVPSEPAVASVIAVSDVNSIPTAPTSMPNVLQERSPVLPDAPPMIVLPMAARALSPMARATQPLDTAPAKPKPLHGRLGANVSDALELSQFAVAALKQNEVALARQKLEEALLLLK